jgi:hypothetical protein
VVAISPLFFSARQAFRHQHRQMKNIVVGDIRLTDLISTKQHFGRAENNNNQAIIHPASCRAIHEIMLIPFLEYHGKFLIYDDAGRNMRRYAAKRRICVADAGCGDERTMFDAPHKNVLIFAS